METFSALLALCAGNSPVTGEFPAQRPVTRSFGVFFDLRLNKRLSKQSWGWWFETLSRPLWRHCNDVLIFITIFSQLSLKSGGKWGPWASNKHRVTKELTVYIRIKRFKWEFNYQSKWTPETILSFCPPQPCPILASYTICLIKHAHAFVGLFSCAVILSFLVDSCNSFTYLLQGCVTGTGQSYDCSVQMTQPAEYNDTRKGLPQSQWSNPEEYG